MDFPDDERATPNNVSVNFNLLTPMNNAPQSRNALRLKKHSPNDSPIKHRRRPHLCNLVNLRNPGSDNYSPSMRP